MSVDKPVAGEQRLLSAKANGFVRRVRHFIFFKLSMNSSSSVNPCVPSTTISSIAGGSSDGTRDGMEETAKDSADINAFYRSGLQRNDGLKAVEVLPILKEKVAYLSGGRDKRGGPILTFPARTNHDRIRQEDLRRLISYLACIPRWTSIKL